MIVGGAGADMHTVYPLPLVVAAFAGALCFAGGCAGLIGIGDLDVVSSDGGTMDSSAPFDAIEGAKRSGDAKSDGTASDGTASDGTASDGTASDGAPSEDAPSGDEGADTASSGGVPCPTSACAAGETCCGEVANGGLVLTCANGACSGGASAINCVVPAGCSAGAYCCATVVLNGGSVPTCVKQSVGTDCEAQCVTSIAVSCTTTDTLRLCAQASDCDPNHAQCCACAIGQLSAYICADPTQVATLNLTCL
jgi:hypothetical protein